MPPDVKENLRALLADERRAKAALKRAMRAYAEALAAFIQAQVQLAFR